MKILLYLTLLFGGAIVGFFVAAVCAISKCSDCAEVQRQRGPTLMSGTKRLRRY